MNDISLPVNVFSRDALLYTLNEYKDSVSFKIESNNNNFIIHYEIRNNKTFSENEFMNSMIENSVRMDILNKTENTRKMILARAFSSTIINLEPKEDNNDAEWNESDILNDWFESKKDI